MRSDLELLTAVTEELKYEPSLDEKEIGTAVANGIVTLTGKVPTCAQKFVAERAVERVAGVRAVTDELMVKLPPKFRRSDADIALAVVNTLKWDTEVPDEKVEAKVLNGWVTLQGRVEWYFQKAAAERTVRFLAGVKGVTNRIDVAPAVSAPDVKQRIEDAIKRSAELDSKSVAVEAQGGEVTLRGTVRSWIEREEVERAAWSATGVTAVDDRIVVRV